MAGSLIRVTTLLLAAEACGTSYVSTDAYGWPESFPRLEYKHSAAVGAAWANVILTLVPFGYRALNPSEEAFYEPR